MKESNNNTSGNRMEENNSQGINNINKTELNRKIALKRKVTMNHYINVTLDNMGFTKYHLLLFITNALFLFCEGMNEIIHIILLSMINEKHNLSHYHLAFMNSIEYLGYTISTLLVHYITTLIKRKHAILISVFVSILCTGLLPTKIRGFVSTMILLFFPLGEFCLSLTCYFKLKEGEMDVNYKLMLLFPFIFTCIISLSAIFLQESPRELFFGKQNYEKGAESFKKITEFNRDESNKNKFNFGDPEIEKAAKDISIELGEIMPNYDNNNIQNENEFNDNIKEGQNIQNALLRQNTNNNIFKMARLRQLFSQDYLKYTILFWILGSFSGFIFYGIHFMLPATAPKINKNTFLDLVLFESMEIPPNFFAMLLIENKGIGRKNTIRAGFIITFIISLINIYLGETILLFDCLLKFSLTIPLNILFVYSSEIYDSHVRTLGLSLMNFWKKLSSLFSPFFMSYIIYKYGEFATHLYYAPLLAISAFGSLFLTIETRGRALDEIIILDK